MLSHIHIKNLGIIEEVDIDFTEGLNVITGETGAGKTLIINAINMILGNKVSKDNIRTGEDKASVEALIYVSPMIIDSLKGLGIDFKEDELVISREISGAGKSISRVNGRIVSIGELKNIGAFLIDLHGQHDSQSLLDSKRQIDILDDMALQGNRYLLEEYQKLFSERKELKNKLIKLGGDELKRQRSIEFLKFQIDEIENAKLKIDEDTILEERRKMLSNSQKIIMGFSEAYDDLYEDSDNASKKIQHAIKSIQNITAVKDEYNEYVKRLETVYYDIDELTNDIKKELRDIETDPRELENIEERLDVLFRLKRKYGSTIAEMLTKKANMEHELNNFLNFQEIVTETENEIKSIEIKMRKTAAGLSLLRKDKAAQIEKSLTETLKELEMPKTKIKIMVDFNNDSEFSSKGMDKIEFLFAANEGEELKPLDKIASGGETSRIMLALKTVLAEADKVPTMVFDEIDTGISGKAGFAVADKLYQVSKEKQVICVTHLASIAAKGSRNLYINKVTEKNRTVTQMKVLNESEVIYEIARITSGGNITETALAHAKEIRNK